MGGSNYLKRKQKLFDRLGSESERLLTALKAESNDDLVALQYKRQEIVREIDALDAEYANKLAAPDGSAAAVATLRRTIAREISRNRNIEETVRRKIGSLGKERRSVQAARAYGRTSRLVVRQR